MTQTFSGDTGASAILPGSVTSGALAAGAVDYSKMLPTDWANSKTSNGYTKLPNGLILQWGTTGTIVSGSNETDNFSIPFPTNCFQVIAGLASGANLSTNYSVAAQAISLTQCRIFVFGGSSVSAVYWLAIGY